jgi:hypothetical protein
MMGEEQLSPLGDEDDLIPDYGKGRLGYWIDWLGFGMDHCVCCLLFRVVLVQWMLPRQKLMNRIESDQFSALSP